MKTKLLALTIAAASVAALPAAAAQAGQAKKRGVVLRVEPGGKVISIVGPKGRAEKVKLSKPAPRGLRGGTKVTIAGGKVASASGKVRGVKLRGILTKLKGGKVTVTTPSGTVVTDLLGAVKLALAGIPTGQTIAINIAFNSAGTPVASVAAPGGSSDPYSDPYADPYTDPYTDPYVDPVACDQPTQPDPVTVIAVSRSKSKIMVVDSSGTRSTYSVTAEMASGLRRGAKVVVTDSDDDGTAEAITAATKSREIEGTVVWIDTDFGAFGVQGERGDLKVVNASDCQLALLTEGGGVKATVHRDADGEIVADTVEATETPATDDEGDDEGDEREDDDRGQGHGGRQGGNGRWASFFDQFWNRSWR
ncbi:MAG: hypothetical protein WCO96_04465 [Actinomycetes bacterium]